MTRVISRPRLKPRDGWVQWFKAFDWRVAANINCSANEARQRTVDVRRLGLDWFAWCDTAEPTEIRPFFKMPPPYSRGEILAIGEGLVEYEYGDGYLEPREWGVCYESDSEDIISEIQGSTGWAVGDWARELPWHEIFDEHGYCPPEKMPAAAARERLTVMSCEPWRADGSVACPRGWIVKASLWVQGMQP